MNTGQFIHGFQTKFIYFDNDPRVGWGREERDHLTEETEAQDCRPRTLECILRVMGSLENRRQGRNILRFMF